MQSTDYETLPSMAQRIFTCFVLSLTLTACSTGASVVGGDAGGDAPDTVDITVTDTPDTPPIDIVDVTDSSPLDIVDVSDTDAPDARGSCMRNEDCASDPAGAVCDTTSGRCVQCLASADTCPAAQHCDGATNTCVTGCRSDDGCSSSTGDAGTGPRSRCETTTHQCVECVRDEHCPPGNLCVGQVCVTGCSATQACPAGQACCSGACIDTQSNIAHCGVCNHSCSTPNAAPGCMNGTCTVASCQTGFGDCDTDAANGCETDTRASIAHCGACGNACTAPAHATAVCTVGTCGFTCETGFADCDGDRSNGCEVDLGSDPSHCGGCATRCDPANAMAACVMGRCTIASCTGSFRDCDTNAANGCETDSATAVSNCGACGNACPVPPNGAPVCVGSMCRFTCVAGFSNCDSDDMNGCETDTRVSAAHCGTCGRACRPANATGTCVNSVCTVAACTAGHSDCDGDPSNGCETSPQSDARNCGACGHACRSGERCLAGVCELPEAVSVGCASADGGTAAGANVFSRFCTVTGAVGVLSGALPTGTSATLRLPLDAVPASARVVQAFLYRQTYDRASTYLTGWTLGGTNLMPVSRRIGLSTTSVVEVWRADITAIVRGAVRAGDGSVSLPLTAAPLDSSGGFGWWLVYEDSSLPYRTVMVYDGMHTDMMPGNGGFTFTGLTVANAAMGSVAIYGGGDDFADVPSTGRFVGPRGTVAVTDITEPASGNYSGVSRWDVFDALSAGSASPTMDFSLHNYSAISFAVLDVITAQPGTSCDPTCARGEYCYGGRCFAPRNCRELKEVSPGAESGRYTFDLDGAGVQGPVEVYCDMQTDGGGWTWLATVTNFGDAANMGNWLVSTPTPNHWEAPGVSFNTSANPGDNADVRSAAFGVMRGRSVMITHRNQFLLRTFESCLPQRSLASHFASLGWTCSGSENFTTYPFCTHPCVITRSTPRAGDISLLNGAVRNRLFLKAGEADGAQDTNRDRAYFSTEYRDNVDYSPGLGAFCSGVYCNPRTGETDVNGRSDAITPAPGTEFYGIWLR